MCCLMLTEKIQFVGDSRMLCWKTVCGMYLELVFKKLHLSH